MRAFTIYLADGATTSYNILWLFPHQIVLPPYNSYHFPSRDTKGC